MGETRKRNASALQQAAVAVSGRVQRRWNQGKAAERWGLVNSAVLREQLLSTTHDHARRIAANAPLAVRAAKELAIRSRVLDLAAGLGLETMVSYILLRTVDVREDRAAFVETRAPRFRGP